MNAEKGDKVRLRSPGTAGTRGIVQAVDGNRLIVRLDGHHKSVRVSSDAVTNLSLAARKAWRSMPLRQVGRPPGSKIFDRVSVTLRIDRKLWERFQVAERLSRIPDRTKEINNWFKEKLEQLDVRKH